MTDRGRKESAGDAFREGVRSVAGVLGAVVETLEQTFADLRESNDLSPERAREAARSTVRKAQETVEDLKDRLDFVTRREFDALSAEVAALRAEIASLGQPPGGREPEAATQATEPAAGATEPGSSPDFPIDEG